MKKKIVIVGHQINISKDYSEFIDNSDYVIRFNKMESYNKNTGTKTEELVCRYANAFNIIHGFNKTNNCIKNLDFTNIKLTVVLNNFNDDKALIIANNICKTNNICSMKFIYNNLNNSYNNEADTNNASTGKIMIEYVLKNYSRDIYDIYIVGFNWFNLDSNIGHLWKLEKEQIMRYINNNTLFYLK